MPKYTLRRARDAYAFYVKTVEANSPEEALELADDDSAGEWEEDGQAEYDDCLTGVYDEEGDMHLAGDDI